MLQRIYESIQDARLSKSLKSYFDLCEVTVSKLKGTSQIDRSDYFYHVFRTTGYIRHNNCTWKIF